MGRKWGIVVFSLICVAFGVAYPFAQSTVVITALGFAITAGIYVLSSFSVATYVPELFPTQLRLRGSGFANTVGRAVSIVVPYAVASAFMRFGIAGVLTTDCRHLAAAGAGRGRARHRNAAPLAGSHCGRRKPA